MWRIAPVLLLYGSCSCISFPNVPDDQAEAYASINIDGQIFEENQMDKYQDHKKETSNVGEDSVQSDMILDGCVPKCWTNICGPDGCGGVCGICPEGTNCSKKQDKCISISVQKGFGGYCGQTEKCKPVIEDPYKRGSRFTNPDWPLCLDDQCQTGMCVNGICTKKCKVVKDDIINHTGEKGTDGIEDIGVSNSECGGAVKEVFQEDFICVEEEVGSGICLPKSSFKPCKGQDECPSNEACGFLKIKGIVESRCLAQPKNGVSFGDSCQFDPYIGKKPMCKGWACSEYGCSSPCETNNDCKTKGAKCNGGKCFGSGRSCTSDEDCGAWECQEGVVLEWPDNPLTACIPKSCAKDMDCGDPYFYCKHQIKKFLTKSELNAPRTIEGRCSPKLIGGGELGEICDETKGDGMPDKPCENQYYCIDHRCSAMCENDDDCGGGEVMKCGVKEFTPEKADGGAKVLVPVCIWIGGDGKPCMTDKECKNVSCTPYLYYDEGNTLKVQTICMDPPKPNAVGIGNRCGAFAFGMECNNKFCLLEDAANGVPGWCSIVCESNKDCPGPTPVGSQVVKWLCEGHIFSSGGDDIPENDLYVSWCTPYPSESSFDFCVSDNSCKNDEICHPSIRVGAPSEKINVEKLCITPFGGLKRGEICDPTKKQCASGFCSPTTIPGVGFCSGLCENDQDCADLWFGTAVCDYLTMVVGSNVPTSVKLKWCHLKVDCVVCKDDMDCPSGFRCADIGTGFPDYRCVKACSNDADCGSENKKCTEMQGSSITVSKPKVCMPVVCSQL